MTRQLVWGGPVWGRPECDAVLVEQGLVTGVGRAAEFDNTEARQICAQGGSILPGFVDGHTHLVETGLAESGFAVDLTGLSRAEALARIADVSRARAGMEWVLATGWDESRWEPATRLRRADLDLVAHGAAVVAVRVDGHVATLNSAALRRAGAVLEAESRLVDAHAGEVRETAVDLVRRLVRPDEAALSDALRAAAAACHRLGITTAHVLSGRVEPHVLFDAAARLRLRLVVHPSAESLDTVAGDGLRTGDGDDWARWGGVKLFADGSVGACNAAFSAPYVAGGTGELNHSFDEMSQAIAAADRRGWQTLTHAIGDRAIDQVLRAHREAGSDRGLRHRIEHYEFPADDQIEATRALGLAVCMQPNFIGNWSGPNGLYARALGPERDARCNPLRAIVDADIPLGFGSDGMPLGPLYGIASAVAAPHDGQRITLTEAVRAYTAGSASLAGRASLPGTLAVGAPADLVVLDGPLDSDGIAGRRVAQTWVGGERISYGMEDG